MRQSENKRQDGRFKPDHIDNHIKYEKSKQSNYKGEIVKLDKNKI